MDGAKDSSSVDDYDDGYVFEHIGAAPSESVQLYISGGLHPVHLGDVFGHDGRYKILRKLGHGGYSTIWLAQDTSKDGSFVALKFVRADCDCAEEIGSYDTLNRHVSQHPGSKHVMVLNDHFGLRGLNGHHECLVYEVLGPSVTHLLDGPMRLFNDKAYLTLECARKVVYQVLLGLDFMHSIGLAHGDVYASNVLFQTRDLSSEPLELLGQPVRQIAGPVKRVDGTQQPTDPRYITLDRPLDRFIALSGDVKLSDLGNSFRKGHPPEDPGAPPELRSPEMIVQTQISTAQDCWAFGCLVYKIYTGSYPFSVAWLEDDDCDDAHFIQLFSLLGPLPAELRDKWPRYSKYFNAEGQLTRFDVWNGTDDGSSDVSGTPTSEHGRREPLEKLPADTAAGPDPNVKPDAPTSPLPPPPPPPPQPSPPPLPEHEVTNPGVINPKLYPSLVTIHPRRWASDPKSPATVAEYTAQNPLRETWLDRKYPELSPSTDTETESESELICDFLLKTLVYEPDRRLSTKQMLAHRWILDYCQPDSCSCNDGDSNNNNNNNKSGEVPMGPKKKRKRSCSCSSPSTSIQETIGE